LIAELKEKGLWGQNDNDLSAAGKDWRGNIPYLRLIHCLLEDDIKRKYLERDKAMTRVELDGRNSNRMEPTVWDMISDRWNSHVFCPITCTLTIHEAFIDPIDCSYGLVAHLAIATPRKVKDKISEMRTDLLRIIQKWEQSGQGEGGNLDDDDENNELDISHDGNDRFGDLNNRSPFALQSRSCFLGGKPPYLLYFWELAWKHDLLLSSLQKLSPAVALKDGSRARDTLYSRGATAMNDQSKAVIALSASINNLAKSYASDVGNNKRNNIVARMDHLGDERRKLFCLAIENRHANPPKVALADAYDKMIVEEIDPELKRLEGQLKNMN